MSLGYFFPVSLKRWTLKISVYECVYICMSVLYVLTWCPWRPEEGSGPLGLELQTAESHHMAGGTQTQPGCSYHPSSPTSLKNKQTNKKTLLCLSGPKSIYPLPCEEQLVRWIIASSGARAPCLGSPHWKRQIWATLKNASHAAAELDRSDLQRKRQIKK